MRWWWPHGGSVAITLCGLLALHFCWAVRDTVVVTQYKVDPITLSQAQLFFHALQATNPRSSLSQRFADQDKSIRHSVFENTEHRIYVHACLDTSNATPANIELTTRWMSAMGVQTHQLNSLSTSSNSRNDTEWGNLVCASQVSHWLFVRDVLDVNVLFVGMNLLVLGDLRATLLHQAWEFEQYQRNRHRSKHSVLPSVYCLPKQMPKRQNDISAASLNSVCELDVLLIPSEIGTDWYLSLNATTSADTLLREAAHAFHVCVRSVTSGVQFFDDSESLVVRAGRIWSSDVRTVDETDEKSSSLIESVIMVEVDSNDQKISIRRDDVGTSSDVPPPLIQLQDRLIQSERSGCHLVIDLPWEYTFHTATIIQRLFMHWEQHRDAAVYEELLGCAPIDFRVQFPNRLAQDEESAESLQNELFLPLSRYSGRYQQPRIVDTVMVNDELVLMQLRARYLKGLIDAHVAIEGHQTFSGFTKDILHFRSNFSLFSELTAVRSRYEMHNFHSDEENVNIESIVLSIPSPESRRDLQGVAPVHLISLQELLFNASQIEHASHIWLNEFHSRNVGVAMAVDGLQLRPTDVLLLLDVDEIPHRHTIEVLRALYAFDPVTMRPKTLLPRLHRLHAWQFRYSFDCQLSSKESPQHKNSDAPEIDERGGPSDAEERWLLSGTAGVAVRLDIAKSIEMTLLSNTQAHSQVPQVGGQQDLYRLLSLLFAPAADSLDNTMNQGTANFVTLSRTHRQPADHYYEMRDVIVPGGWHLSFFGGIERVANKLQSYSHQNFAERYRSDKDDTLSLEKIHHQIKSGLEINPNSRRYCVDTNRTGMRYHLPSHAADTMQLRNLYDSIDRELTFLRPINVIFLSGHIGAGPTLLPPLPSEFHPCVFVTNNEAAAAAAAREGFIVKRVVDIPLLSTTDNPESWIRIREDLSASYVNMSAKWALEDGSMIPSIVRDVFNSMQSKWLKMFPQYFLSPLFESHFQCKIKYLREALNLLRGVSSQHESMTAHDKELVILALMVLRRQKIDAASYSRLQLASMLELPSNTNDVSDFVVWWDNKFALETASIFDTLHEFPASTAMMLKQRPECCGADMEFNASMHQARYRVFEDAMKEYMETEVQLGFPAHGERHFRTGLILYNMNHPELLDIQSYWQDHVRRVGIQCQIAFYFAAQSFPSSIEYFPHDGWYGRYSIFVGEQS